MNKNGVLQNVRIFPQYIPQPSGITINSEKKSLNAYSDDDYEANFPCIVVKLIHNIDNEENIPSTARVDLLFGAYDVSDEAAGYRDLLNMAEKVRDDFYSERITNNKFFLNMPAKLKMLDTPDTWPVFFAVMELEFVSGRTQMHFTYMQGRNYHHGY